MSGIDRLLRFSPFQPAHSYFNRAKPAVLAFHGVDDPEQFALLMDHVRRWGHPITIDRLAEAMSRKIELPERSVLITFDDGHRSVLEHGLPILEERGLPAVVFVVAGLLSTETDFWWSSVTNLVQNGASIEGSKSLVAADLVRHLKTLPNHERLEAIAEMSRAAGVGPAPRPQLRLEELQTLHRAGLSVGNHTWSHPCLNRCDTETTRQEIERAHRRLTDALGHEMRWFAYPNGDWDNEAESVLSDLGYELAFLFDHRRSDLRAHHLRISRLRANSDTSTDRFATILSGLHPSINRMRGKS